MDTERKRQYNENLSWGGSEIFIRSGKTRRDAFRDCEELEKEEERGHPGPYLEEED